MKRRGEKKRKIRVTKRTWNFAFVQLAMIRWNYGKKKIKKGDKKKERKRTRYTLTVGEEKVCVIFS